MKRRDLFRGAGGALLWSAAAQEPEPVFERRGSRLRMDLDGAWRLSMETRMLASSNAGSPRAHNFRSTAVRRGAVKVVFCTLRLLDNLGRDALAEKLLSNLVGYLDGVLPETLRPQSARDAEAFRFRLTQVRDCLRLLQS
ncbi:MAG TPA: hypothetical protein VM120_23400 [Bryobacteraceae bacterium]|nr:hypothetical protein [Bryobacteraceae bacterium]